MGEGEVREEKASEGIGGEGGSVVVDASGGCESREGGRGGGGGRNRDGGDGGGAVQPVLTALGVATAAAGRQTPVYSTDGAHRAAQAAPAGGGG